MKTKNWLQGVSSLFLMMTMTLSVAQPGLAASAPLQPLDDGNTVYDPVTGALAFIGTEPGKPKASMLVNASSASPAMNASAFMAGYADQLGLNDVSAELALANTFTKPGGRSTVRYQQTYQGIPVFAGEVIVNTNAQGAMLSLTAKTSPNLDADITPTLTADDAVAVAIKAIAKYNKVDAASLTTSTPKLQIYDSRLLNPDGVPPRLVWNIVVSALSEGISEVVLIDARNGAIALHYNQIDSVDPSLNQSANDSGVTPAANSELSSETLGFPNIGVYTLNHATPDPDDPAWPGTFVCNQSNKAACDGAGGDDIDATRAYLNSQDAYNFMKNYLGIDSIDNAGAPINASIHYGTGNQKVFWVTGVHTASYGSGYTTADDMAGHAIGFGLIEYSGAAALVLQYQPGAIAESLADMWGEFIDQTNGRGTDTAAVKWVIGEDWPSGKQRNMQNPAIAPFLHPDKMSSPYYYLGDDGTGIFRNAGVNNKAVFLMVNGGTFNGRTIIGQGILKIARIYYEVESQMLASASTYFDLYYAVKQACYNQIGTNGITSITCDQVRNALDAVQMNLTKSSTVYPVAKYCPTGKSKGNSASIFFESLESGTSNWTLMNPSSPSNLWHPVADSATHGQFHFEGPEPDTVSQAMATTNSIVIPTGYPVYMFFEHWFNFETIGTSYHDGALLLYSTDNGATWKHTSSLYASGLNYNGTIASGLGNPWAGQKAFVSYMRNYVSTSLNLSSLAGQSVKFLFLVASDSSISGSGWYVDNIQIYRCVALPGTPALISPTLNFLSTVYTPTLDWSNSIPDVSHYIVQVSTSSKFTTIVYEATTTTSVHKLTKALTPNLKYYWRVRAYNVANDSKAWSAARYFRTSLRPPVLQSPIGSSNIHPIFNWADVPGAKGYTIQLSRVPSFSSLVLNLTIQTPTSLYKYPKTLLKGKLYYWRVRANGTNGPSLWTTKSFTPQ